MSVEIADARVEAGAAVLDEGGPADWRDTLYARRDELAIQSTLTCPLGLIFGSYDEGRARLGVPMDSPDGYEWAVAHGFDWDEDVTTSELNQAWLDEIEPPL
jgi:hypothetical protein